jgi:SAM-dependent methyltransferase
MDSREERRRTFDGVAELYDRLRPGYPDRLFEDVVTLSAIPPGGRILEIGAGPGKATVEFARRGYPMTCLEPGPNLARIARRNLAAFPGVRIEECTFEDWPPSDEAFDLVVAAQSFHFLDPAPSLAKVARVLRAGGALAIFGNHPEPGDSEADRRIQEAFARHAPALAQREEEEPLEDRIDESGRFGTVFMSRYRWQLVHPAADYVGLMETQSHHQLLPPEQRTRLLQAIGEAITAGGGSLVVRYVTRLRLARRLAG